MPTCYQTTATTAAAAAAMMKKIANASWLLCGKKRKNAILLLILSRRKGVRATHRDVKELLCVVQHADPDGDVASGGHGGRSVARIQRTDAKSLRGSETLPCPGGNGFRVWLCHGAYADGPRLTNTKHKTQNTLMSGNVVWSEQDVDNICGQKWQMCLQDQALVLIFFSNYDATEKRKREGATGPIFTSWSDV